MMKDDAPQIKIRYEIVHADSDTLKAKFIINKSLNCPSLVFGSEDLFRALDK